MWSGLGWPTYLNNNNNNNKSLEFSKGKSGCATDAFINGRHRWDKPTVNNSTDSPHLINHIHTECGMQWNVSQCFSGADDMQIWDFGGFFGRQMQTTVTECEPKVSIHAPSWYNKIAHSILMSYFYWLFRGLGFFWYGTKCFNTTKSIWKMWLQSVLNIGNRLNGLHLILDKRH